MDAEKLVRKKQTRKQERPSKCVSLGKRLTALRLEAGIKTQTEMAKRLPGITANEVSNWEIGFSAPDIFLVPEICRALNCSYAQFFGGELFTFSEQEISDFSKIATLNPEDRRLCLSLAAFLHDRQLGSTVEK